MNLACSGGRREVDPRVPCVVRGTRDARDGAQLTAATALAT